MGRFLVFIVLAYIVGILEFLKINELLTVMHFFLLALGFGSIWYQIVYRGISKSTFTILLLTIVFPIYASIQSSIIFGQPFLIGLASMRYMLLFNFGLFLNAVNYDYRLLIKQINNLNIFIAISSIIAVFILGINSTNIYLYISNNNFFEKGESSEDMVKGIKLTICSGFMVISYIYYLLRIMGNRYTKRDVAIFILLMFYQLFVHKGRQPLALICCVYGVYYIRMKGITLRRIILGFLPLMGIVLLMLMDSSIIGGFTAVLDGSNSSDFSTLARLNSINSVLPYIRDHFILGVGNLSYHFNDGFQSILGYQFYIADIGLFGAITRGGIVLMVIYYALYRNIYLKANRVIDPFYRSYYSYMLFAIIIKLIVFSGDDLVSGGFEVAMIFYPLLTTKNPNTFLNKWTYQ